MIRRYSLLTIALMCAVIVSADPVSKSVARQIAKNFLQGQGKTVKGEPARAPRMKEDDASTRPQPIMCSTAPTTRALSSSAVTTRPSRCWATP